MCEGFVARVLEATARADLHECLFWRTDGPFQPITFFVDCSDSFTAATAEGEPVTEETIAELENAIADAAEATGGDPTFGPLLYCARRRQRRPLAVAYPSDSRLWPLFDAIVEVDLAQA